MTKERKFGLGGEERSPEPLHYTQCGLDDVYLVNGFSREETEYGPATSVHNVDGLHCAIGLHIVSHKKTVSAKAIKFLRRQMHGLRRPAGKRRRLKYRMRRTWMNAPWKRKRRLPRRKLS